MDEQKELRMLEQAAALEQGRSWFKTAAEALERAADELKRYQSRYETAASALAHSDPRPGASTPWDVIGWTAGNLAQLVSQFRFDLAADSAAATAKAFKK
jgi:hypothetical protein